LIRRGWGEFPIHVQIHFKDARNKRIDINHQLKLDGLQSGLQTYGGETTKQTKLIIKPNDVYYQQQQQQQQTSIVDPITNSNTLQIDNNRIKSLSPINDSSRLQQPFTPTRQRMKSINFDDISPSKFLTTTTATTSMDVNSIYSNNNSSHVSSDVDFDFLNVNTSAPSTSFDDLMLNFCLHELDSNSNSAHQESNESQSATPTPTTASFNDQFINSLSKPIKEKIDLLQGISQEEHRQKSDELSQPTKPDTPTKVNNLEANIDTLLNVRVSKNNNHLPLPQTSWTTNVIKLLKNIKINLNF
jgi:hypothetical protein